MSGLLKWSCSTRQRDSMSSLVFDSGSESADKKRPIKLKVISMIGIVRMSDCRPSEVASKFLLK